MKIRVLVACEESQAVCIAFRERGHEAYSCDLQECSGGHPEWHIKGDALELLKLPWDLLIAHPPCTYMAASGAVRMYPKGELDLQRYIKGIEAKNFFMKFFNAPVLRIAIENPQPLKIIGLPEKTQIIQPYEYGEPYSKKTYLWLKNLPKLIPTCIIEQHICWVNSEKNKNAKGYIELKPWRKTRASQRSKTFPGIAKAMAEQWGGVTE